jgi:two-component system chemotaxis sensor kinase CheA
LSTTAPDDEIDRVIPVGRLIADVVITAEAVRQRPTWIGRLTAMPRAAAASAGSASELVPARQHRHIRIDLHRLDTLMNLIGELVITRGRLQQLAATINEPALTRR